MSLGSVELSKVMEDLMTQDATAGEVTLLLFGAGESAKQTLANVKIENEKASLMFLPG